MEGKTIAITSWICVTLIILLVLWITQLEIDFFGLIIFIVILYAIPFILSIYVLEKKWNTVRARHCGERGHEKVRTERSDVSNGLEWLTDIEKREGYLRFLNSLVPSISVMYWNPFSISFVACLMLVAVLQVYSSSSLKWSSWV